MSEDRAPRFMSRDMRHGQEDREQPPFSLGLVRRMFSYTRPYAAKRNLLFLLVFIRAIQVPLIAYGIGAIINGPIVGGDPVAIGQIPNRGNAPNRGQAGPRQVEAVRGGRGSTPGPVVDLTLRRASRGTHAPGLPRVWSLRLL